MQVDVNSSKHPDPQLLRTYAGGIGPQNEHQIVKRHLQECHICADKYIQLVMKTRTKYISAPDRIWFGIDSKLNAADFPKRSRRAITMQIGFALLVLTVMCGLVGGLLRSNLLSDRTIERKNTLELGQYLDALEQMETGPNQANLSEGFSGSSAIDRDAALALTRLDPTIDNYNLVSQRVLNSGGNQIIQLLYDSGTDSFAVFVLPDKMRADFGSFHMVDVVVNGHQCTRAECTRQDVYHLNTGAQTYVFIRKHRRTPEAGELFAQLTRRAQ